MPAASLPQKLHSRLDELAARVRKVRVLRAVARAAFLLPVAALVCILVDAYLGLPTVLRAGLLIGWIVLALREAWNLFHAFTAKVDLEAVASAVEMEFPRLAERLTTAVELAGKSDESNGAPALIDEVIKDADSRARKLQLANAFPTSGASGAFWTALILCVLLLIPAIFAPHGGEYLRRFFLPGYTPAKSVPFTIDVRSGDPAVKRGDAVTLVALLVPTKPDAVMPSSATLVVSANGAEERLAMASDETNVWYYRRPAATEDFDYRIEAGDGVSETHHVTVVDPITLGAAHITIKPPAYAAAGHEHDPPIEGLGELVALEHSTIAFDLRFVPKPTSAILEFVSDADADSGKPAKQRHQLKIADDGSTKLTVPAKVSGTFALKAEGARGVRSEFPSQPLRIHKDEPPKLPRINGIGEKPRQVRPTEKIVVECAATDDVAITKAVLEWRIDDGPIQTVPFVARGLPAAQIEGKAVLSLTDKVKIGQKLSCRLAITDNRDVPEAGLKPQTAYYPTKDQWAEFAIDASAAPLAEQDIVQRKAEIESKLQAIRKELKDEHKATDLLKTTTAKRRSLDESAQKDLKTIRDSVTETGAKLDDLARDVGITPDLSRMADTMRSLADREVHDANDALGRAKEETSAGPRSEQFEKAKDKLQEAMNKIDELLKENERIAQERLDRRKLEDLAHDQQELADKAKTADPKDAAELARKQKELEAELAKLKEQSEAIKRATDAAKSEEAKTLAEQAKRIADEQRNLNEAIRKAEKDSAEGRLADLKKRQDELAKKAKELADKTDAASRVAQTQPLKPDDAAEAKNALDKGNLDEAMQRQEQARQELDRLARDLEQAAADSRDPREAAKQLARLQEDLRGRLAQETKDKSLDKLPADRRAALEKQQEEIEKAAARIKVPQGDSLADLARQQAVSDAASARDMLKKGAGQGADEKMKEVKESLERLADRLPTKDQRLERARQDLASLKKDQDAIQKKAEAATKSAERQDPDAATTQRDLANKLADTAKQQADLADKLSKMDAPGQDSRKEKTADAMQKAAGDLTAGRPQDIAASQQAAKRELDRLEQALNGQTPADEKVAELAKKQRQLAEEAAKNAAFPDRPTQQDIQRRQGDIARELDKLQTPEAATTQAEAADAAKKAETSGNGSKPDEFAKKTKDAADKLDQLNERVNGQEPAAEAANRLAKRQRANADDQEKRKDPASTSEARKKAAQELDELKNMRAGQDAQKTKQQAQDALQRAANAVDPANNAKSQRDAADAMKDLADKLSRDQTAKRDPTPKDPAEAAEQLAQKQRELADKTKQDLEKAKQMPGDAGDKAKKDALDKAANEQRELATQAGELPGQDAPKDRQQAQDAMNKAGQELDKQNADGANQRQKDAADALDRMAKTARQRQRDEAGASNPDLPNKSQADAARQLAEEQKKLQDEARKAAEDMARENSRKDNPVEELAKQQQQIAREAGELAKTVNDRQGAKSDQAKQARQAADSAKQTSDQVKNGDLKNASESGKQAAQAMEQMGQDKAGGESAQKAKDLARRQADLNQKLDELAKDSSAGKAQQAARQQELENQARDIGQKFDEMAKGAGEKGSGGEKAREAGQSAKQSGDKMQNAREAGQKGQRDDASISRQQAADAMDRAARQAAEAAKELANGDEKGNGSPRAGESVNKAQDQMGKAGQKLGQGQPGEAGNAMEKAADSLQQASNQLGQGQGGDGQPKPGQGPGGKNPGGNIGGPGGKLDLSSFGEDVKKYDGKSWGELPGEIKTKIIQQMKARYGEDYARNIKLYFEQLAERK
jgi:hypothetical protein